MNRQAGGRAAISTPASMPPLCNCSWYLLVLRMHCAMQVKVAEHVLTGLKVAIKILNRKKIKQMDMEEKGACLWARTAT